MKTSSQTAKRGWNIKNAHNTAATEESTRAHHHGLCSEYGIRAGWKMKLTGWKVGAENHRLIPRYYNIVYHILPPKRLLEICSYMEKHL